MADNTVLLYALNRGEISTYTLARTDLEHLRLAAEIQENWLPRVLGPMMLRPGSEYIGGVNDNLPTKLIPFIAAFADTALLEMTNDTMRVWIGGTDLIVRSSVGTTIPAFSGWTSTTTGTATATLGGSLVFSNVNFGALATATAIVLVGSADRNTEHGIRVVIQDGPIIFRIGSTSGGNDIFADETLDQGTYSFGVTPGVGIMYIEITSTVGPENFNTLLQTQPQSLFTTTVSEVTIESAGPMAVPTPWATSVLQVPSLIRFIGSADVVFVACPSGVRQYQINRYAPRSWSVVRYKPVKGPMNTVVGSSAVKLYPSVQYGNGNLNSTVNQFSGTDVGTLFRLYHDTQTISQTISFSVQYTDSVQIYGVSTTSLVVAGVVTDYACTDRQFTINTTGTWTGNLVLERSFEGPTSGFTIYQTYSSNQTNLVIDDGLNNELIWYRMGFQDGTLTSGAVTCEMSYPGGGGAGVCHVVGYNNPQQVQIEILVPFASTANAADWHQSEWSLDQGFPTSVAIHEGRLWWAGADRWWGSSSDDYTNFDYDAIGDASYIDVEIGQGPIDNINWLLSLDSLLGGSDTSVIAARSDAIQDPLTPTNFNLRFSTATGSAPVQAVRIDNRGIYIDQSTRKLFELVYDLYTYNYKATEISNLNPDIGLIGYVGMAIQRNPDTRIWLPRSDGQLVCLLYDVDDQVKAFWRCTREAIYEDIVILPGAPEDQVFLVVNRSGVRSIEKFARIDECVGGLLCKNVDSHVAYSGSPTNALSAPWLANQSVVCWADGTDISPVQLDSSGDATLGQSYSNLCYGLGYTAQFLSAKLAYGAKFGTAINQIKRIDHIGFVLQDTHYQGIVFGSYKINPFDQGGAGLWDTTAPLDPLPLVEYGEDIPSNTVWAYYDNKQIEFPGDTDTDARIFLQAAAPRPCTVVGVTLAMETSG